MNNPYEILEVLPTSSPEDIDRAYRNLAKKYHPDLNPGDLNCIKKFKDIQNAYESLKKRKRNNDFSFEVNNFFHKSSFKGKNIQSKIELTLKEVFTGCTKKIRVLRKNVCSSCSGSGCEDFLQCNGCGGTGVVQLVNPPFQINKDCNNCGGTGRINVKTCNNCAGTGFFGNQEHFLNVKIPKGVFNGSKIVLNGCGDVSSRPNGSEGDLIVIISVKDHPIFKREGFNIILDFPITYSKLILGSSIKVPCISGESILVDVPKFSGLNKLRVKGQGLVSNSMIGDMIINLRLDVPKKIDENYKNCLKELSFFEESNESDFKKSWEEKFSKT